MAQSRKAWGVPLARADAILADVQNRITFPVAGRQVSLPLIPVGSVRRRRPRVGDLDALVVAPPGARLQGTLPGLRLAPPAPGSPVRAARLALRGDRHASLALDLRGGAIGLDLFMVRPAELPYALFHYTGSPAYNIRVRALAKRAGLRLNQYGLYDAKTGRAAPGSRRVRSERELADLLGISHRPPTDRER